MGSQRPGQNHDRDTPSDFDSSNEISATSVAGTAQAHGFGGARTEFLNADRENGDSDPVNFSTPSPTSTQHGNTLDKDHRKRRNRGYSLRRSIFTQNVQRQSSLSSPIEMNENQASNRAARRDEVSEKRHARITTTEPIHDEIQRGTFRGPFQQKWLAKQTAHANIFTTAKGAWNVIAEKIFRSSALPPSPNGRHVRVSCVPSIDAIDERTNKPHIDNMIISCRYTLYDFVPRQLVAQFSKLANFYFLCIAILQMIPGLSTTGTYTTIVPLLIFVSLSMAKEGHDDLRRHRLDKEENEREVYVLEKRAHADQQDSSKLAESGYPETTATGWRCVKWQHVQVGQVVLLLRDEPVPADVVLLHVDEPAGSAFIETKSLDGETNLKAKKPPAELSDHCHGLDAVADLPVEFIVEDPNLDLYKFEGQFSEGNTVLPLTNNEVVYRGSVLRNTSSALGVVIYSGEESKIRMNASKAPRIKAPALQGVVNKVVIFIAALVFSISLLMAGLYEVWRKGVEPNSWYLASARVPFGNVFVSFVIMFNTMLPLSLYVSLEIVKVAQMFQMNDIDMYDPETDTPMEPHTSTINEELGQVSYIFSDKTGTLTNNSMKFRKISIAGTAWLHDFDLRFETGTESQTKLLHKERGNTSKGKGKGVRISATDSSQLGVLAATGAKPSSEWKPSTHGGSPHCGKTEQLLEILQRKPDSVYARKAKFFILGLALCHTCVPETDGEDSFSYQAASPDELALVTAAQDLGYIVTDRQSRSITIKTYPGGEDGDSVYDVYEVLDVIEFSSGRKRMSIVVRFPDRRICLFTKGADTTVRKLLRLAELAETSVSTVHRQASRRKSLEAQEYRRRHSTQLQASSRKPRSSINLPHIGSGRASSVSAKTPSSARDSVDQWLRDRENEVDMSIPPKSNSFYTPRQSLQRGNSEPLTQVELQASVAKITDSGRSSVQLDEIDKLVDQTIATCAMKTFEHCFRHIDDFASEGLRTLLYGYRFIPEEEYKEWQEVYASASTSIENRQEKMEAAGESLETNLELLGCTAIEDKLQKGVPDAIDRFRRAGIKMWMLTGDKRETAINIGHSCRLIKDYSTVLTIDHEVGKLHDHLTEAARKICLQEHIAHSVIVIDGQTLTIIDAEPGLKALFTDIAVSTDAVICCRASPSQKASLVRTIRTKLNRSVTLAIGDGANDVAMLLEADIGIGIAGKEGMQAARISDYSIAQFRFLVKLLLVHGRWNYVRICKYTLGTFWKEMLFYLVQAMYQRWNGYTGTSLYEPWSLTMFNTLFTSLPVIFMGVFEKDLAAPTLLAVPELYNLGRRHEGFDVKLYVWWAATGAAEAVIVFFIVWGIFGEAVFTIDNKLFATGCLAYTICVILISVKLQGIELHNKALTAVIASVLSVGGWFLWNLALAGLYDKSTPIYDVWHGFTHRFGRDPLWWLTLVVGVVAIVILEVSIKTIRTAIKPTDTERFQILEHDLDVRKRFEEAASDLLQQGWQRGMKKSSFDIVRETEEHAQREKQVQELLERPRTVDKAASEDVVRSRSSTQTDSDRWETINDKKHDGKDRRRSIEISELFAKGFGKVKGGQQLK